MDGLRVGRPSLHLGREINELSPLISGAAISPHIVRAWTLILSTLLLMIIAAPFWSGVCCAIYGLVAALVFRLELRALPSNSRMPASARLDRAL